MGTCFQKDARSVSAAINLPVMVSFYFKALHISFCFIVLTVFILIMKQTEFCLVHNEMENYHYDHIPFNSVWFIIPLNLKRITNGLPLGSRTTLSNFGRPTSIQFIFICASWESPIQRKSFPSPFTKENSAT